MINSHQSRKLAARPRAGWSSALLILSALLALPALVQAQLTFTTNNGAITITGYNPAAGPIVVIPAMTNGYQVTSIAGLAFINDTSITSVTIPNGVTNIGNQAFFECGNLMSVSLPASVISIGSLEFGDCARLTNINVDADNMDYSSTNGVLFDEAGATLIECPGGLAGSYAIPDGVTTIGYSAFYYCTSLTNVTIPSGVTKIQSSAFQGCSRLTGVTIPTNVTSIGQLAFGACTSLKSVNIPASVTSIALEPFEGCVSLTGINVDADNQYYSSQGGVLFDEARKTLIEYPGGLAGSYAIPGGVTSIEEYAFDDCTSLTSVTIPDTVTSIGFEVFALCSSLMSVTIPASITSIGEYAFLSCGSLRSVTIPASVTSIGDYAFDGCTSLTSVYFQGNEPTGDGTVFSGDSATAYYLPGASGWTVGETFGSAPEVLWNPQANTLSSTGGHFGFNLTGPAKVTIVVEASSSLSNPVWQPVSTNTLSGLGTSAFSDPTGYPMRFYRFRSP